MIRSMLATVYALLIGALLASFLTVAMPHAANAEAHQIKAGHTPAQVTVTKAVHVGKRYVVVLNTGGVWVTDPCKMEDSRNCYWDARHRGNGKGRSFFDLHGTAIYKAGHGVRFCARPVVHHTPNAPAPLTR